MSENSGTEKRSNITALLHQWREGDDIALEALTPMVYDELYTRARGYMMGERRNHTLNCTALVNEAYIAIIGERERGWENRSHFFAVAATIMKNLLVRHARARVAQKRGGDQELIAVDDLEVFGDRKDPKIWLDLCEAIEALEKLDSRKAWIFQMKFLVGMSIDEITAVLDTSERTVKRDIRFVRAWLHDYMNKPSDEVPTPGGDE